LNNKVIEARTDKLIDNNIHIKQHTATNYHTPKTTINKTVGEPLQNP